MAAFFLSLFVAVCGSCNCAMLACLFDVVCFWFVVIDKVTYVECFVDS